MAIKILNKAALEQSGHATAAAEIVAEENTTVHVTETSQDETVPPKTMSHEHTSSDVIMKVPDYEIITIGMSFKMPVASFTMVEFHVERSSPTEDPDATYQENKDWVENKINDLVAEQSAATDPATGEALEQ